MPSITTRVMRTARKRYGVTVYDRSQWGSRNRATYQWRRRFRKVTRLQADTLVQHITVTLDTGPLTGDLFRDVRTVERIGMERFSSGVSYNFVVDMRSGSVCLGQSLDAKGTHTVNDKRVPGYSRDQNAVARAFAVLGMPDDALSSRAERAIAGLIAAMIDEGALTVSFDYEPHSRFAWKDCPCDATRDRMRHILYAAHLLRFEAGRTKVAPAPLNQPARKAPR